MVGLKPHLNCNYHALSIGLCRPILSWNHTALYTPTFPHFISWPSPSILMFPFSPLFFPIFQFPFSSPNLLCVRFLLLFSPCCFFSMICWSINSVTMDPVTICWSNQLCHHGSRHDLLIEPTRSPRIPSRSVDRINSITTDSVTICWSNQLCQRTGKWSNQEWRYWLFVTKRSRSSVKSNDNHWPQITDHTEIQPEK